MVSFLLNISTTCTPTRLLADIIQNSFWRKQAEQCQWVEDWEWRYRRFFDLPEGFNGQWIMLQFDGLDTFASIYLNGKQIVTTNDMFVPYEFNISKYGLKPGKNEIEVRFAPPVKSVLGMPLGKYSAAFDASAARVYIRRMQCTFGWDWVNRLITAGIWRSYRIVSYNDALINDVFAYTTKLDNGSAMLKLQVSTSSDTQSPKKLKLFIIGPDGKQVWKKTTAVKTKREAALLL